MLNHDARNLFVWLGLTTAACAAGQSSGARPPEAGASNAPAPIEAELRAAPPSAASAPPPAAPSGAAASGGSAAPAAAAGPPAAAAAPASPAPAAAPGAAVTTGAGSSTQASASSIPVAAAPLECVVPRDPELDKESSWSREVGQRIERELAKLQSCNAGLPPNEQTLTLRLVYAKDGSPISQHVVASTAGACAASECLKRALANVRSPTLLIDKASVDVSLALAPGQAPQRRTEPTDPLAPESLPGAGEGCVDADVARLSREKVREVVSTAHSDLKTCYGKGLERDHALAGRVDFEFIIGQDGLVSEAWAREATLGDCEAIRCMLTEFRALQFPEPVGRSIRVLYPINYLLEPSSVTLR